MQQTFLFYTPILTHLKRLVRGGDGKLKTAERPYYPRGKTCRI